VSGNPSAIQGNTAAPGGNVAFAAMRLITVMP